MTAALLPPIPRPPHDPTSLLCDGRVGWPIAGSERTSVDQGHLTLERAPGSLRWLTEAGGSFGGLRLPANMATDGSDIWLLDAPSATLLRFDACTCAFEAVACFGGPRQLLDARGIAIAGRRLFVCDAGNARLGVYVLPTLALAGHWAPSTPLGPAAWTPTGVVADQQGIVHVADPLNGMVHRFSPYGAYIGHRDGVGASTWLALGSDGAIFAAGPEEAFRLGPDGSASRVTSPADDLAGAFPAPAFEVDEAGKAHLGARCVPPVPVVFDRHGAPHPGAAPAPADRYERSGTTILGPLDSWLDGCTWHRVILRGELPDGCRVAIATHTSEIELPGPEIEQLPEHAWETRLDCSAFDAGAWDGLVRGAPGRYLWLRLELRGNGRAAPRLENVEVELPRISLRRYLPAVYGAEPASADFTDRLLAIFDRSLRDTERAIDVFAALFDPRSTPAIGWLASWIGVALDRQVPEDLQRSLLRQWSEIAALRGTRHGLWRLLVVYLGLEALVATCQRDATQSPLRGPLGPGSRRSPAATCPPSPLQRWAWEPPPLILEHYQLRRWLEAGVDRLGDQAVLWGSRIVNRSQLGADAEVGVTQLKATQDPRRDPFHVYAHRLTVFVPAAAGASPERRRALERLVAREVPAHTDARIEYVGARFRIGIQSMIGLDAVVARVPADGVTLGKTAIRAASVLTGDDAALVDTSRIGTTSVLE